MTHRFWVETRQLSAATFGLYVAPYDLFNSSQAAVDGFKMQFCVKGNDF